MTAACNGAQARERLMLAVAIAVVVPLGFWVKFRVCGAPAGWCNLYGAGVLYEIFWILVLRFGAPRLSPVRCGLIVFLVTCALEILQLWQPGLLEAVRRTFLGAAVIGTTFDPWDFPHYLVGSAAGVLAVAGISNVTRNSRMLEQG